MWCVIVRLFCNVDKHNSLDDKRIDKISMARLRVCDESALKLLEYLQNDLKNLSIETKKKFPHIKEVCKIGGT